MNVLKLAYELIIVVLALLIAPIILIGMVLIGIIRHAYLVAITTMRDGVREGKNALKNIRNISSAILGVNGPYGSFDLLVQFSTPIMEESKNLLKEEFEMTVKDYCNISIAITITVAVAARVIIAFRGAFTLLDAIIMIGLSFVAGILMAIGVILKRRFFG